MKGRFWSIFSLIILLSQSWLTPVVSRPLPDQRFGITEAFWQPEEAAELGVGWERILFYWRELQPMGPEDWNTLHVLEEWLVEADTRGRKVVGLLKNTAPWASEDGTEAGLPKGLYLNINDPENLWASFVRKTASYYGERGVTNWIIWNEPEIKKGVYGFEFAGNASDYYQLLKVAYKVIKTEQPEAVIHLAGLTWWHDQSFLNRLLMHAVNDPEGEEYGYFFDVISLHLYFRTESIPVVLNAVKSIQERYSIDKPIWINETNAPPNQDPGWPVNRPSFEIDLEQQAWFIIQAFALGFASGADSISVYKLIDIHIAPGEESFGLLRPDLSRRPAYEAYKTATTTMRHFSEARLDRTAGYYQVTLELPEGTTHVLWTRSPTSTAVTIPSNSEQASLLRFDGKKIRISSNDGFYRVELEGARCNQECLVGGPPIILTELDPKYSPSLARIEQKLSELITESIEIAIKNLSINQLDTTAEEISVPEETTPDMPSDDIVEVARVPTTETSRSEAVSEDILSAGTEEADRQPLVREEQLPKPENDSNNLRSVAWIPVAILALVASVGLTILIRIRLTRNDQ